MYDSYYETFKTKVSWTKQSRNLKILRLRINGLELLVDKNMS